MLQDLQAEYLLRSKNTGEHSFSLITIGNKTGAKPGVKVRDLSLPVEMNGKRYNIRESEITFPLSEFSFASRANAEQFIRDRTWDTDQVDSADHISCTLVKESGSMYRLRSQEACTKDPTDVSDIPLTVLCRRD